MLTLLFSFSFSFDAQAQGFLNRLKEKAVEKVKEKIENKVEREVDDAMDKALDGKGKNRQGANEDSEFGAPEMQNAAMSSEENDFVPGSIVLFEDNLAGEKMGEFPSKWDISAGSVGVTDLGGRKVIKFDGEGGRIYPLMKKNQYSYLPEEFTLEFDYYLSKPADNGGQMNLNIALKNGGQGLNTYTEYYGGDDSSEYCGDIMIWWAPNLGGGSSVKYRLQKPEKGSVEAEIIDLNNTGKITGMKAGWNHFAMSFNQRAMKVYINGKRIINAPNVIAPKYVEFCYQSNDYPYCCLSNIRLGTAGAELYERNASDLTAVEKSMQETGKFVTNNILFETGKATLLPESMEEIQKVADYMLKNKSVRFEVQGHCDNQGSDKVNDPLSQSRAEAVVAALVKLGVDEWNLRAVGKGSHEPIADNKTKEGQAKNRRVEFIKR
ncbi:MAG: OmpA family protein [Bacteroidaceae bacterium]|nr:OmpA family protein [Bacteroidaceae bacterium]